MKLTRKKAKIVEDAVREWETAGVIKSKQAQTLLQNCEVIPFDWKRLAKYSFWIAIICIVTAIGAVLADQLLLRLLARFFNAPAMLKCAIFAGLAIVIFYLALRRKRMRPEKVYSNEAIFVLGVISVAISIAFLGEALDTGSGHYSILLLFASLTYGILGLWFPSKLVWIFGLLSLGSWFGAETGYISGWGAYYLGMNYPLRFVAFGVILTAASYLFWLFKARSDFFGSTRIMGMLYLFIALWILSIFGNYGDFSRWQAIKQYELFYWSLLFGVAAIVAIFHGVKYDDNVSRGFGLTFLFINLYTRFFEHLWDNLHKAIFFALLAVTFWILGSKAEQIWSLAGGIRKDDVTTSG